MIGDNRIIIAAAGSGKTTYLVEQSMKVTDARVLITTYTESNEAEIRQKFFDLAGRVPAHVTIMTWFSFLITHGVKRSRGACSTSTSRDGVRDHPVRDQDHG